MSTKNILQEYCQQRKINLPQYTSESLGPSHKMEWFATAEIIDLNIMVKTIKPSSSKTIAEQLVAKEVLEMLKNKNVPIGNKIEPIKTFFEENHTFEIQSIVLIDLENIPMFKQILQKNVLYIGFHNTIHNSLPKYKNWYRCKSGNIGNEILISKTNMLLYLIEGGVPDLVDHFMTTLSYPLAIYISLNPMIKSVHIISGDHAGFCTRACLEKIFEWNNISGIIIKNIGSVNDIAIL